MTLTRTPYFAPHEMSFEQRAVYDAIVASRGKWLNGPYAPMLLQPRLAEPAHRLGEFLRYHTSLGTRLTELTVLIIARHWDCDFEWHQHAPIALDSGVAPDTVESIRQGERPAAMDEQEQGVYDFTRELLERHRVPDGVYARATELFGAVGVVELTAFIGYYTFIAFSLLAHEVPLPASVTAPLMPPARRAGKSAGELE